MKRCYLFGIVVMLLCAQAALAQTFSVKGVLRDPLGRTVEDGSYKLTLRLYTQAEGGSEVWSEVHSNAQAQHGVVSLELGTVTSLSGVGFSETFWLGIQVENNAEMAPRIKLGTNPYSLAVKGENNVFPSAGHVGINTLAPTQPLEVNGNAKVTGALIFSDGSSMSSADLGGTASSLANPSNALITTDSDDDGSGEIQFLTGTSTDMVISNAGNVGIGTTTPANNLSVAGAADISGNLGIGTATPASKLSVAGNADITGNLGIGTATPASKLSVAGNADITGNLGIGTATPGVNLAIAGAGSAIELGADVAGKQVDAGKIGYALFSSGLDITGAGSDAASRRVTLWAEGGTELKGGLTVANGAGITGNTTIAGDANISGGTRLGDAIVGSAILSVAPGVTYFDHPGIVGGTMTVDGNNRRVGIGTNAPQAALHVTGNRIGSSFTGDYWADTCHGCPITNDPNIIAYFNGNVLTNLSFIAATNPTFSDQRTKRSDGRSDGDADLETLMGIEITDYKRIDPRATGGKQEKKVIAQQVVEVYPRAVSYIEQVIPNVYAKATDHDFANSILTVKTAEAHGFAIGDRVDVFTDKEDLVKTEVLAVDGDRTFSVAATQAPGDIFVYGKWVDDFHVVDYDALSMLNISATQELARRLQAVERENVALRTELDRYQALKAENALLKVRMERFEAVLQRLDAQQAGQQRVENVAVKVGGLSLAD